MNHGNSGVTGVKAGDFQGVKIPYPFVPAAFYGDRLRVAGRFRRLGETLFREGSWRSAIGDDLKVISLLTNRGDIVMRIPSAPAMRGGQFFLGFAFDEMMQAGNSAADGYRGFRMLLDEYAADFWMALFCLSDSCEITSLGRRGAPSPRRAAKIVLARILRWWPEISAMDGRINADSVSADGYENFFRERGREPPPMTDWKGDPRLPEARWRAWGKAVDALFAIATAQGAAAQGTAPWPYGQLLPLGPVGAKTAVAALVDRDGVRWDERLAELKADQD